MCEMLLIRNVQGNGGSTPVPVRPHADTRASVPAIHTDEGSKVAVPGDYRGALALGHTVVPIIMEVFGGWGPDACKLFRQVARCHRDLLDPARTYIVARTLLLSLPLSAHLHCHPLLSCR